MHPTARATTAATIATTIVLASRHAKKSRAEGRFGPLGFEREREDCPAARPGPTYTLV